MERNSDYFLNNNCPENHLLAALWYDAHDDWEAAHGQVDDKSDRDSSWIHAYLHRKEGDEWNARYWYRRAGKEFPNYGLQKEWEVLFEYFSIAGER